jgi:cell division initiation protein
LEITVESLRGFESRYRSKLQEHLTSQLEELKTLKSFEADAR